MCECKISHNIYICPILLCGAETWSMIHTFQKRMDRTPDSWEPMVGRYHSFSSVSLWTSCEGHTLSTTTHMNCTHSLTPGWVTHVMVISSHIQPMPHLRSVVLSGACVCCCFEPINLACHYLHKNNLLIY